MVPPSACGPLMFKKETLTMTLETNSAAGKLLLRSHASNPTGYAHATGPKRPTTTEKPMKAQSE
jgi:hypothetical protein